MTSSAVSKSSIEHEITHASLALDRDSSELLASIRLWQSSAAYTVSYDHASRMAIMTALGDNARKLDQVRRELLSWRNSMLPVHTLPTEILLKIFHMITKIPSVASISIHAVSQTCGRWRSLALSTPSLWTTLDLSTGLILHPDIFIERSLDLPLTLFLLDRGQESEDQAMLYQTNPTSVKVLHLVKTYSVYLAGAESLQLTIPHFEGWVQDKLAPHLKHLNLCRTDYDKGASPPFSSPRLFSDSCTQLESLRLRGFYLPWSYLAKHTALTKVSLSFASLGVLENGSPPLASRYSLDNTDMLGFFRECGSLEEFTLHCAIPFEGPLVHPDKPILLSHLRTLSLSLHSQDLTFLLASIHTPPDMTLDIMDIIFPISQIQGHHIGGRERFRLPLDFDCLPCLSRLGAIMVNFREQEITGRATSSAPLPSVTLRLFGPDDPDDLIHRALSQLEIPMRVPFSGELHVLDEDATYHVDAEYPIAIMNRMPYITAVELEQIDPEALELLCSRNQDPADPLWPNLRKVTLSHSILYVTSLQLFCQYLFKAPNLELKLKGTWPRSPTTTITLRREIEGVELIMQDVMVTDGEGQPGIQVVGMELDGYHSESSSSE